MFSKRLRDLGLAHQIFGQGYNFRQAKIGDQLIEEVNRALDEMGVKPREVYSLKQDHTDRVRLADLVSGDPYIIGRHFDQADGLVTDYSNVALLVKFADCTPVLLYDPVNRAQALVHSGWRGTAKQISHKALQLMVDQYGSRPDDILAFVGPSIDQDHYEVGSEVYEAFIENPARDSFFKAQGDKYLLSMTQANHALLLQAGLKEENIEVCQVSTYNDDRLHSARQMGPDYQLNAMVSMISPQA